MILQIRWVESGLYVKINHTINCFKVVCNSASIDRIDICPSLAVLYPIVLRRLTYSLVSEESL